MRALVLTIVSIGAAMLLLCVGIIFRKDHSFRSQHVSENPRMKENKIHCATSQDREAQKQASKKLNVKSL